MRKLALVAISIMLVLSTLACRLPFIGGLRAAEEEATEEAVTEAPVETESIETEEPVVTDAAETESAVDTGNETQVYSDSGVEITLPASYILGDVENDLAVLVEGLQAMSENEEDADDIQQLYEQNKDDIMLWGYDSNSPSTHQTSLLVMKNEEFAGMSLAIIATFANVLLGEEVNSISNEQMALGDYDVLRFLTTSENAGVETAQAIYLFNAGGKLWMVGFFTNQEQIDTRLPSFDAAVASFTIVEVE